jgi:ADP-heptose:LPS heptosyltransferase
MSNPKLALFEFRMIGDAVMALPFIASARGQYDITVCCTPAGRDVFRMVLPEKNILCWRPPWFDESGKYSPDKLLRQFPADLLRELRRLKPEIGVSSWADPRTSLIMLGAGIPRRIGFDLQSQNYYGHERPWRAATLKKAQVIQEVMKALGMPLLTESLKRNNYFQHHVEDWAQLCGHLGLEWKPEYPWLTKTEALIPQELRSFVKQHQVAGRPLGILHGDARTDAKRWPSERFQKLVEQYLIPNHLPVILIDLKEYHPPEIHHPLVKTFRPESLDAYVQLACLADYSICNDTGSAHLGAATGRPVVTVFSNSLPEWFAPFGNKDLAVDGGKCAHKPCLEHCVMPTVVCRDGVTVEKVADKLSLCLSLLRKKSGNDFQISLDGKLFGELQV